jgi:putative (di)nucleoside polyphosphate hydrolase
MPLSVALTSSPSTQLPLRPCVGIVLFNRHGQVWVGRRRPKWARASQPYVDGYIWQPPQGGIDKGELARDAAFRELHEETGVTHAALLAELPGWLSFRLPHDLMGVALKGKFGGQRLRWFAMRLDGNEDEIDLQPKGRAKREFDAWRWADLDELPDLAVAFKRPVYEAVAAGFAHLACKPVGPAPLPHSTPA